MELRFETIAISPRAKETETKNNTMCHEEMVQGGCGFTKAHSTFAPIVGAAPRGVCALSYGASVRVLSQCTRRVNPAIARETSFMTLHCGTIYGYSFLCGSCPGNKTLSQ